MRSILAINEKIKEYQEKLDNSFFEVSASGGDIRTLCQTVIDELNWVLGDAKFSDSNSDSYYIEDGRQYRGSKKVWISSDGTSYTIDIRYAKVFSENEVELFKMSHHRSTDVIWKKSYIDGKRTHSIDEYDCDNEFTV